MTRIEALDVAIELLQDYIGGSSDADEDFEEAEEVLVNMRNNMLREKERRQYARRNEAH